MEGDRRAAVFNNSVRKVNDLADAAFRLDFGGKIVVDRLALDIHEDSPF